MSQSGCEPQLIPNISLPATSKIAPWITDSTKHGSIFPIRIARGSAGRHAAQHGPLPASATKSQPTVSTSMNANITV